MKIGNHDTDRRVYFIAEMGLCHYGSYDLAAMMVEQARTAGADAIKTQAFYTDYLTADEEWQNRLRGRALPDWAFEKLKALAGSMDFICTPHDDYGLEIVKSLDPKVVKVGSGEVGNIPFLERIASLAKPLIISTGMHDQADLEKLHEMFSGRDDIGLLHCVSSYPALELNLGRIRALSDVFTVGYSDHSASFETAALAVAAGARIIETHFHPGLKADNSNDAKVSLSPQELIGCVHLVRYTERCMGDGSVRPRAEELETLKWARKDPATNRRGHATTH